MIKFKEGPSHAQSAQKIFSEWGSVLQQNSEKSGRMGGSIDHLTVHNAYEVNYLSRKLLENAKTLLDAVYETRWEHLVMDGEKPHASVELDSSHEPVTLKQGGKSQDGFYKALEIAGNLPELKELGDDVEVCVIKVPEIRFIALCAQKEDEQWVIPYEPNQVVKGEHLKNYEATEAHQALIVLQQVASEFIEKLNQHPDSDRLGG